MKIVLLDEIDSTNRFCERMLDEGEDLIVCARRQTEGMGTNGRSFLSDEGGVYLSALTFYDDLPAGDAFRIMAHAALSVCRTAEDFGLSPRIKWPNDVLVGGKKLAGILIRNVIGGGKIRASIVGIGLNVCNDLSALGGIALSLSDAAGKTIPTDEARDRLIGHLKEETDFRDYLSRAAFLGEEILVCEGEKRYSAIARRILPDGRLEIDRAGAVRALSSAEIRIVLSNFNH